MLKVTFPSMLLALLLRTCLFTYFQINKGCATAIVASPGHVVVQGTEAGCVIADGTGVDMNMDHHR